MDPYEYTQTVNDPIEHEVDDDDLKKLEKDLAPSSADFYGILNISKKVIGNLHLLGDMLLIMCMCVLCRQQRKRSRNLTKSCAVFSILTRYTLAMR